MSADDADDPAAHPGAAARWRRIYLLVIASQVLVVLLLALLGEVAS